MSSQLRMRTTTTSQAHPSRSNKAKNRDAPRKQRLPLAERLELKLGVSVAELNRKRSVLEGGEALRRRRAKSKENAQIYVRYDSENRGGGVSKEDDDNGSSSFEYDEEREAKRFYNGYYRRKMKRGIRNSYRTRGFGNASRWSPRRTWEGFLVWKRGEI